MVSVTKPQGLRYCFIVLMPNLLGIKYAEKESEPGNETKGDGHTLWQT